MTDLVRTATVREKDWQQVILDAARLLGWLCFHTFDARRSSPGFPDLMCVRGGRLLAIECKTERGRLGPWQETWLDELKDVPGVVAMVARPSDWPDVERALKESS